ncbi:MAG: hypothetical protein K0S08_1374 [Gammaproteobacteria bacterium]|nr:hypothetical protein [Gammaproteobacteria bacterium]
MINPKLLPPKKALHQSHIAHFDLGVFLAAGPNKNKLGGVILVKSMDKAELKKILAEDSYVQADVADYKVTDMDFKLASTGLEKLTTT